MQQFQLFLASSRPSGQSLALFLESLGLKVASSTALDVLFSFDSHGLSLESIIQRVEKEGFVLDMDRIPLSMIMSPQADARPAVEAMPPVSRQQTTRKRPNSRQPLDREAPYAETDALIALEDPSPTQVLDVTISGMSCQVPLE